MAQRFGWADRLGGLLRQGVGVAGSRTEGLQKYLYSSLDEVERSFLHEDVGNMLEEFYFDHPEEVAAQLARHFSEGRQDEKALCYLLQAGEKAHRAYANKEAAEHLERARDLIATIPRPGSGEDWRPRVSARIHESLGEVRAHTGRQAEARAAYETALNQVPEDDRVWTARLHRQIGASWQAQHMGEKALASFATAESTLGPRPSDDSPPWWHEWIDIRLALAWTHYFAGHDTEIRRLADEMQPMLDRFGTLVQRVTFLISSGSGASVTRYPKPR